MYKVLCFDFWILSGQDFITFQINNILKDLCFGSAINNYYWLYCVFFLHDCQKLYVETKKGQYEHAQILPLNLIQIRKKNFVFKRK